MKWSLSGVRYMRFRRFVIIEQLVIKIEKSMNLIFHICYSSVG